MLITKLFMCIVVLMCLIAYYWFITPRSTYVKSTIDNKYYLVLDLPDKQDTANELAQIRQNIKKLAKYMASNDSGKHKKNAEYLREKLKHVIVAENINDFYYTSYSVNKGERLVFCTRSKKGQHNGMKHDMNLMMYVVLHEISHIMCPEYGHGETFKEIFKYVTNCAIEIGIYNPIDFRTKPTEYCGMMITDSIV